MANSKDIFEKCDHCKNLDTRKSNKNWRVCKFQPMELDVLLHGADKCKRYDKLSEVKHDTK